MKISAVGGRDAAEKDTPILSFNWPWSLADARLELFLNAALVDRITADSESGGHRPPLQLGYDTGP